MYRRFLIAATPLAVVLLVLCGTMAARPENDTAAAAAGPSSPRRT